MTRVSIILTPQGPMLHITRRGGPTEDRLLSREEVARLMAEVAEAWLWLAQQEARGALSGPP